MSVKKEATRNLNKVFAKKREAKAKLNFYRKAFKIKEDGMREDLEEASRIWKKIGERFRWWQSLP